MANTFNALFNRVAVTASAVVAATSFAAPAVLADTVQVDGSSTVFPVTEAAAEEFIAGGGADVVVGVSGTGGGFKKFCVGETDISGASRPIKPSEMALCAENGIEYVEIPVAYDALTIVVSAQNSAVTDISVDQLARLWDAQFEGEATRWSDLDPSWPAETISLYGPGSDSGTFDYFVEEIIGEAGDARGDITSSGEIRGDFTGSEDDNILVVGVSGDANALGYFGLAYYEENASVLNALTVNGVAPTPENVNNGSYAPLSRPIFIYVNTASLAEDADVAAFVDFYVANAAVLAPEVGYVALPDAVLARAEAIVANAEAGTVFSRENPDELSGLDLIDKLNLSRTLVAPAE